MENYEIDSKVILALKAQLPYINLVGDSQFKNLPKDIKEKVKDFALIMNFYSNWGFMDSTNTMNVAHILKMVETCRTNLFGLSYLLLSYDDFIKHIQNEIDISVISRNSIQYYNTLTHPDQYLLASKITNVSQSRFEIKTQIYSLRHYDLVAEVDAELACIDLITGKSTAYSESYIKVLEFIFKNPRDFRLCFTSILNKAKL